MCRQALLKWSGRVLNLSSVVLPSCKPPTKHQVELGRGMWLVGEIEVLRSAVGRSHNTGHELERFNGENSDASIDYFILRNMCMAYAIVKRDLD